MTVIARDECGMTLVEGGDDGALGVVTTKRKKQVDQHIKTNRFINISGLLTITFIILFVGLVVGISLSIHPHPPSPTSLYAPSLHAPSLYAPSLGMQQGGRKQREGRRSMKRQSMKREASNDKAEKLPV